MAKSPGFTGVDRIRKVLRSLPDAVTHEVADTVYEQAEQIRSDAYDMAPVSDRPKHHMRDDIELVPSKDGLTSKVGFITTRAKRRSYYAGWIEFGTKKMSANPFFWPAVAMNRKNFYPEIREAVRRALSKAKGGA